MMGSNRAQYEPPVHLLMYLAGVPHTVGIRYPVGLRTSSCLSSEQNDGHK
jgi:hypothetical protein